jgi:hypothetical protein|tara:strand:- start:155 stop:562 length:408 start_codon:yes stop_codon:yes gene_type:complete
MKLAFIIIPHEKASSYQIDKYTGQLGKKFNGCTYYEVKGTWHYVHYNAEHTERNTSTKIEVAMEESQTDEFVKIATQILRDIGSKQLMIQLPDGTVKFLEDKPEENTEYLLIGGTGTKSISNGYSWSECKVKETN